MSEVPQFLGPPKARIVVKFDKRTHMHDAAILVLGRRWPMSMRVSVLILLVATPASITEAAVMSANLTDVAAITNAPRER